MGDMLNTNMRLMGEIVSNKMGMEMVYIEKFKRSGQNSPVSNQLSYTCAKLPCDQIMLAKCFSVEQGAQKSTYVVI